MGAKILKVVHETKQDPVKVSGFGSVIDETDTQPLL